MAYSKAKEIGIQKV